MFSPNEILCYSVISATGAGRADHGVRSGGAGEHVRGEDAAGHRDGGGPGHRVRRGRGVRRLPLARGGGRQRDGVLRQMQRLRPSGQERGPPRCLRGPVGKTSVGG